MSTLDAKPSLSLDLLKEKPLGPDPAREALERAIRRRAADQAARAALERARVRMQDLAVATGGPSIPELVEAQGQARAIASPTRATPEAYDVVGPMVEQMRERERARQADPERRDHLPMADPFRADANLWGLTQEDIPDMSWRASGELFGGPAAPSPAEGGPPLPPEREPSDAARQRMFISSLIRQTRPADRPPIGVGGEVRDMVARGWGAWMRGTSRLESNILSAGSAAAQAVEEIVGPTDATDAYQRFTANAAEWQKIVEDLFPPGERATEFVTVQAPNYVPPVAPPDPTDLSPTTAEDIVASLERETLARGTRPVQVEQQVDWWRDPEHVAETVIEQTPQLAAQVGAGVAVGMSGGGPSAGAATFVLLGTAPVVGQVYEEALAEHGDPSLALAEASTAGYITAITERIPATRLFMRVPGGEGVLNRMARRFARSMQASPVVRSIMQRTGARVADLGEGYVAEAAQEVMETAAQDVSAEFFRRDPSLSPIDVLAMLTDPEKMQEYLFTGTVAGFTGFGASGVMAGPTALQDLQTLRRGIERGQQMQAQEQPPTPPAADLAAEPTTPVMPEPEFTDTPTPPGESAAVALAEPEVLEDESAAEVEDLGDTGVEPALAPVEETQAGTPADQDAAGEEGAPPSTTPALPESEATPEKAEADTQVRRPEPESNINPRYLAYQRWAQANNRQASNAGYMAWITRQGHAFRAERGLRDGQEIGRMPEFTEFLERAAAPTPPSTGNRPQDDTPVPQNLEPAPVASPTPAPGEPAPIKIDPERVRALLRESAETSRIIAEAMGQTEAPAAPEAPRSTGLHNRYAGFADALTRAGNSMARADADALARRSGLMLSGAIDAINDWAVEHAGRVLVYETDTGLDIDPDIAKALAAAPIDAPVARPTPATPTTPAIDANIPSPGPRPGPAPTTFGPDTPTDTLARQLGQDAGAQAELDRRYRNIVGTEAEAMAQSLRAAEAADKHGHTRHRDALALIDQLRALWEGQTPEAGSSRMEVPEHTAASLYDRARQILAYQGHRPGAHIPEDVRTLMRLGWRVAGEQDGPRSMETRIGTITFLSPRRARLNLFSKELHDIARVTGGNRDTANLTRAVEGRTFERKDFDDTRRGLVTLRKMETDLSTAIQAREWEGNALSQDDLTLMEARLQATRERIDQASEGVRRVWGQSVWADMDAGTRAESESPTDRPSLPKTVEAMRQAQDHATAAKLDEVADKIMERVEALRKPGIEADRPTRRRQNIAEGKWAEADALEGIANAARELARRHRLGIVPSPLAKIRTRTALEEIMRTPTPPTPGVHHANVREVGDALRKRIDAGGQGLVMRRKALAALEPFLAQARRLAEPGITGARVQFPTKADQEAFAAAVEAAGDGRLKDFTAPFRDYNRMVDLGLGDPERYAQARRMLLAWRSLDPRKAEAMAARRLEGELVGAQIPGFFPTPAALADRLIQEAGVRAGDNVLEPSAGKGDLVDAILRAFPPDKPQGVTVTAVEINATLATTLRAKYAGIERGSGMVTVVHGDFITLPDAEGEFYDRIVMNPPFERGQDRQHVQWAYDHLAPGGVLVAIVSASADTGERAEAKGFRAWLEAREATVEDLPEGSFKSAFRSTGVATKLIRIERPAENVLAERGRSVQTLERMAAAVEKGGHVPADNVEVLVGDTVYRWTDDEMAQPYQVVARSGNTLMVQKGEDPADEDVIYTVLEPKWWTIIMGEEGDPTTEGEPVRPPEPPTPPAETAPATVEEYQARALADMRAAVDAGRVPANWMRVFEAALKAGFPHAVAFDVLSQAEDLTARMDPAQVVAQGGDPATSRVLASNRLELRDGVAVGVLSLGMGTDERVVLEELAEVHYKTQTEAWRGELRERRREYEQRTGDKRAQEWGDAGMVDWYGNLASELVLARGGMSRKRLGYRLSTVLKPLTDAMRALLALGARLRQRIRTGALGPTLQKMLGEPFNIDVAPMTPTTAFNARRAGPVRAVVSPGLHALGVVGRNIMYRYGVIEAADLLPSHDPRRGFEINPEADPNERQYHDPKAGAASRAVVEDIANPAKFDVRRLVSDDPTPAQGPPIVTNAGVALGGNARSMGLQLIYHHQKEPARIYRAAALEAAERFGVSRQDAARLTEPVLVRIIEPGFEGKPGELSRILNQSATTAKTAEVDAASRAARLSDEAFDMVAGWLQEGEDLTIRNVLAEPKHAKAILDVFLRDGALDHSDLVTLARPDGTLNERGREVVENTMLARIVPDPGVLAGLMPSVRQRLMRAIAPLARLTAKRETDPRDLLNMALENMPEWESSGYPIQEFMRDQLTMTPPKGYGNAHVAAIMRALRTMKPTTFARAWQTIATLVAGESLFTGPGVTLDAAVKEALGAFEREGEVRDKPAKADKGESYSLGGPIESVFGDGESRGEFERILSLPFHRRPPWAIRPTEFRSSRQDDSTQTAITDQPYSYDLDQTPVGSWMIDPTGHELYQLRWVPVGKATLQTQGTETVDAERVGQYVAWIKQGFQPPPAYGVLEPDGTVDILNGRHRLLAERGVGNGRLLTWVRPLDAEGKPLTWESAVRDAIRDGQPVPGDIAIAAGQRSLELPGHPIKGTWLEEQPEVSYALASRRLPEPTQGPPHPNLFQFPAWSTAAPADAKARRLARALERDRSGDRVGLRSIAEWLSKALGAQMLMRPREQTSRKRPTSYAERPHLIRTRVMSTNLLHRHADAASALLRMASPTFLHDFERLGGRSVNQLPGARNQTDTNEEAWGEFVRRYITEPWSVPPALVASVESLVSAADEKVLALLRDATRLYQRHASRGAHARWRSGTMDAKGGRVGGRDVLRYMLAEAGARGTAAHFAERGVFTFLFDYASSYEDAAKTAKRLQEGIRDTAADMTQTYASTLHIEQLVTVAVAGASDDLLTRRMQRKGWRGLRFHATVPPGQPARLLAPSDRKALVAAGFEVPPDPTGHGDMVYLSRLSLQDVQDIIAPKGSEHRDAALRDFNVYGQYKATLARLDAGQTEFPMRSQGVTPDMLREWTAQFERRYQRFERAFRRLNQIADAALLLEVIGGGVSVDAAIASKLKYEHYLPLTRAAWAGLRRRGGATTDPTPGFYRSFGSENAPENPFTAVMRKVTNALQFYYWNRMALAPVFFAQTIGNDQSIPKEVRWAASRVALRLKLDWTRVATLSEEEMGKAVLEYVRQEIGQGNPDFATYAQMNNGAGPELKDIAITFDGLDIFRQERPRAINVLAPMVGGQRIFYQINDRNLYEMFSRSETVMPWVRAIDRTIMPITDATKRAITQNLTFAFRQLIFRDSFTTVTFRGDQQRGVLPGYFHARGVLAMLTGKPLESLSNTAMLTAAFEHTSSESHLATRNRHLRNLFNGIYTPGMGRWSWREWATNAPGILLNTLIKPVELLNIYSGQRALSVATESAPRLGAFDEAVRLGDSAEAAQLAADTISGHFGERPRNPYIWMLLRWTGFGNPRTQVFIQHLKLLAPIDGGSTRIDRKARVAARAAVPILGSIVSVTMGTAFLWALSRLLGGFDDEREEVTEQERLRSAHIGPFRVPFEYGGVGGLQSWVWNTLEGQSGNPVQRRAMAEHIVRNLIPQLPMTDLKHFGLDMLQINVKGAAEAYFNYSTFTGEPIEPYYMQYLDPAQRSFATTPRFYVRAGEALGVSPIRLQYFVRNGLNRQLDETIRLLDVIEQGQPPRELARMPYLGPLFHRAPVGWGSESVRRVDELDQEYERVRASWERAQASGTVHPETLAMMELRMSHLAEYHGTMLLIGRYQREINKLRRTTPVDHETIEQLQALMTSAARDRLSEHAALPHQGFNPPVPPMPTPTTEDPDATQP